MSYRRLAEALLQGQPYFGPALRSLQGFPERHKYFLPVVQAVAERTGIEILEIGSWAGASAISWASALKKLEVPGHVTCVDSWVPYFNLKRDKTGHYERMNHAAEKGMIYKLFQHNVSSAGFSNTIVAKRGKSREVLPTLASGTFDIVYLDGSHVLKDVLFDARQAKRLVRPGGIVCGDDLELQLNDLDPVEVEKAAHEGRDYASANVSGKHYHPGVTLAVAREFGQVCVWEGLWAVRLSGNGWENVTLDLAGLALPEHVASAAITIQGDTPEHYLISSGGRYFALAKQLGPPDIVAEFLGDEDLPPLVFAGSTLGEIIEKAQHHFYNAPALVENYRTFNLVRFKNKVYALRQSLGEVNLTVDDAIEQYSHRDAMSGDSLDGVKARIDAIETTAGHAGPPDIVAKFLGDEDLPPLVFAGSTLGEIREKAQHHFYNAPALVESYRTFNLVRFKNKVYALRQSLGEVNLTVDDDIEQYGHRHAMIGDSLDGVKSRIDALETTAGHAGPNNAVGRDSKRPS